MMNGSIAKRYATALFEEAQAQDVDRQVYDQLGVLHATMKSEPDLQMALINPHVTAEKKHTLLLLAAGLKPQPADRQRQTSNLFSRFLHLLLDNHRENQLRLIILIYRDMYREHHGIDRVMFETAIPVDDAVVAHLTRRITQHTHRTVECERKVTPSIIGGFRLRIGDRRYDYSYKHQLELIKEKLHISS